MKCINCGHLNSDISNFCKKCGYSFVEELKEDYCPDCNNPLLYPDKPCPFCTKEKPIKNKNICAFCETSFEDNFLFKGRFALGDLESAVIEKPSGLNYCEKCYKKLKSQSENKLESLRNTYKDAISQIPILNVDNPQRLTISRYCQMICASNIIEVDSINENLTGTKDNSFNMKFEFAKKNCIKNLKKQTVLTGGNLIIGCDLKFKQLHTPKQMFLISLTATSVVAEEFNVLSEYEQSVFSLLY